MLSQIIKDRCNGIQKNQAKKLKKKSLESTVGQKNVCSKVLFVHSMKAHWGVGNIGSIAPLIINVGNRREWLNSHPCGLTPGRRGGDRYHLIGVSGGPRAGLEVLERR